MRSSVGRFWNHRSRFHLGYQSRHRHGLWEHGSSLTGVGVGVGAAGALSLCRRSWCRRRLWLRLRRWFWRRCQPRASWPVREGQTGEMRQPERRQVGAGENPGAMYAPQPLSIGGALLCGLHLADAFPCIADLKAQAASEQDDQGCSHQEALHTLPLHFSLSFDGMKEWCGEHSLVVEGFLYRAKLNRNDPQEDCHCKFKLAKSNAIDELKN
ncbi:LOW QUALITY PROTEIN: hypothetical protein BT93_I0469 [Corymbia citriodora subsp. variegata]|nr:LOW QUALITY PROTEIN: hypothetical protein BT93_I0469 [Corymbia citriodora subsp. variegata]